MSRDYRCDRRRCRRTIEQPVTLYSIVDGFGGLDRTRLDLCPECAQLFRSWLLSTDEVLDVGECSRCHQWAPLQPSDTESLCAACAKRSEEP